MTTVKEIQSVKNACRVLEVIARRQPVGVSDIARSTGIDKSAAHRIAVTLHASGWLDRTESGQWFLTTHVLSTVGEGAATSLVQRTRGLMEAARNRSNETAMLVVPDGSRLIIAAAVESRHSLRVSVTVGSEMQSRSSSALRAMAPRLSVTQLEAWRRIDPGLTDELIETTRERGWGMNDGEVVDGTKAVGAALCDRGGLPIAALVLVGPSPRFDRERIPELGALVAELAGRWNDGST